MNGFIFGIVASSRLTTIYIPITTSLTASPESFIYTASGQGTINYNLTSVLETINYTASGSSTMNYNLTSVYETITYTVSGISLFS